MNNMTAVKNPSITLDALPAEVLLEIIPYIPFVPHSLSRLRLTCSRINTLIKYHESGIVRAIKQVQSNRASLRLFPNLPTQTFQGLTTLHLRLSALDDLHAQWLHITSHGPDLHWLKGRWENVHKAGLLLLYRIQDSGSYCDQVAMLNGLSTTSLACLVFKLISSIKILRLYGPDPIRGTYQTDDITARSDIELAFEELLLLHGPDFFIAMLKAGEATSTNVEKKDNQWAVDSSLTHEVANMVARQLPGPDNIPRPPTLTSCVRRAFAAKLGCHISQNVPNMWAILSGTAFDEMDEDLMGRVVLGEEVKGGMKRIF